MSYRWYQREAIDAVFNKCREDKNANPLVVAPTGSGKSHIISGIISESIKRWGDVHFIVLAHRKELLVQNEAKLPGNINTGFYCAGLGRKQVAQVTFASIGSVFREADKFSKTKVLIVDECHLIPVKQQTGTYRQFIREMKMLNDVRVIGLTATPYRLDSGLLYGNSEQKIFQEITYDCDIKTLTEQGFLSRIIGKEAVSHAHTGTLKVRGGEFVSREAESLFMQLIEKQCEEIVNYGENRKKWLIFCAGIKHARAVEVILQDLGIKARSLTGDNTKSERAEILKQFDTGEIQAVSNCDVLTTGFDQPDIDMIALLRPTQSTALYVQMVGRGLRVAPGKEDCLLLDFGENVLRHGLIDDIKSGGVDSPEVKEVEKKATKVCANCREVNIATATSCKECGEEFTKECPHCGHLMKISLFKENLKCHKCGELLISRDIGNPEANEYVQQAKWHRVKKIKYSIFHKHNDQPNMGLVTYKLETGISVNKFISIEHKTGAKRYAQAWILENCKPEYRNQARAIDNCEDFLHFAKLEVIGGIFKQPKEILIKPSGKYWDIIRYNYSDEYYTEEVQLGLAL